MFWRFGFHNASSIDSLLDRDDVALEAILDEDELLQECKGQNTRLIDYFQRKDVLQRLLGYVTGEIEGEGAGRFRYPYVATEVLCSEIWSIVETCLSNADELLAPFWENVLSRPPDDMQTQLAMAAHFVKISAVFLTKKPAEMLAFVQAQPNVVERLMKHIETPSFVDLIVRIIQLDEHPAGSGVLEWLSREDLMGRLISLLSPEHTPDVHTVVAELIKGIISIASPSPGAGLTEGLQNGPASNRFARELAQRDSVVRLVGYILHDFRPDALPSEATSESQPEPENGQDGPSVPGHDRTDSTASSVSVNSVLPNAQSSTSSVVNSISVLIELIRKNNSDYFEPYLFHTLRNRLIQIQQQQALEAEEDRDALERAMTEMTDRMGVVHLGAVLDIITEQLEAFQNYLRKPRSSEGPLQTTVGPVAPFTFERFRICELYAEVLHCSNMGLLNRAPEHTRLYDADGRLQGGLSGLEELAQVIAIGAGPGAGGDESVAGDEDELEPAQELPISSGARNTAGNVDSDEEMSVGDEPVSSDDEAMEEIAMADEAASASPLTSPSPRRSPAPSPASSPGIRTEGLLTESPSPSPPAIESPLQLAALLQREQSGSPRPRSVQSRRSSRRVLRDSTASLLDRQQLSIGEKLKRKFLECNVLSTLLDLFFEYPWNNFAHTVVYDTIHQVLIGRTDSGGNRDLTIALFRDARLMHRIVEGQRRNDEESAKPKGLRLGYMGHLTLLAEDVIGALEHYPTDLRLLVEQYAPKPDWDEYVTGRFNETKQRDATLLGGGKPVVAPGAARPGTRWQVDEADPSAAGTGAGAEVSGELRRGVGAARQSTADFGPAPMEDIDDDDVVGAVRREPHNADQFDDDDEDGDGGWLARSQFDLAPPPARNRRAMNSTSSGFEDAFAPGESNADDLFGADDDDAFGPFSDSAAASGADPFTFTSSSLTEQLEDAAAFDSFGEFGEFHSSDGDGELTPTGGSWTFASESTGSDDFGFPSGEFGQVKQESKVGSGTERTA